MKRAAILMLCVFFLPSCGGDGGTKTSNINGSWHITQTSSTNAPAAAIPVDIFIVQNGTTLSADHLFVLTCSNENSMSGSVSGNQVNMVITGNQGDIYSITGTLSSSTSFTGNYTSKTSGCIEDDTGTFVATLIPSFQSPSWSGTITSTQYPPGSDTFTANLTEDSSGAISGTLAFTGKYCANALNSAVTVIGQQTGNQLSIVDTSANGISLLGFADNSGKNVTGGRYGISLCAGDNGDVTMSRP
jgi:hypothetical protein